MRHKINNPILGLKLFAVVEKNKKAREENNPGL